MLVIVTVRDGEPSTVQEMLVALRADPRATLIEPASLSEGAVTTLVRSALGAACRRRVLRRLRASERRQSVPGPRADRRARDRARRAGGGQRPAGRERPARVGVAGRGGATEPPRRRLQELGAIGRRARERLAPPGRHARGHPAQPARASAADRLISAQILAPSATLAFVHPLLQLAVYERIPAAARADGHRRAGLQLAAEGARSTRVGAHLLRGEPAGDPAVVVLLREAARAALADGAPQTAVRLLRRTLARAARDRSTRGGPGGAWRGRGARARSGGRGPPPRGARARRGAGDPRPACPRSSASCSCGTGARSRLTGARRA